MRISAELLAYFASLLLMVNAVPVVAADGTVKAKNSAIRFTSDLEAALVTAKTDDKPVYLAFGAAWCPVCREMESRTLLDQSVQALAEAFVWVAVDIDRNVTLANEWGVEATPTIFLLDPNGNPRLRIVGGTGADRLASMLREFLDDLETEAVIGEPVPAQSFEHTALISKPGGFRGKSICFSNVGYGPLSLRSQSPFQSLRLGILPRTPSTLARGEHQLRVGATWANVWANEERQFDPENGVLGPFLLDYESLDANLSYAHGLSDTFQIELEYEQRWRFGGVMDGFIEGFHDLFGLGQSGRDRWPRNQTFIFVDRGEGSPPLVIGEAGRGSFSQGVLATLQHNVTCGTARMPALSWSATARYAIGGEDLEGSDWDLALSVAAAHRFGEFYLYLTLGYAWYGSDAIYDIPLDDTQFTVLAAGEWRFKPRMSLILQLMTTEGVAIDFDPFSKTSNEVVLGWKWELRQAGVLEIGLLENIVNFDNSPDFGVHAAFTQRF